MTTSSLAGRSYYITGANTGIGQVTAQTLASRGAHVFLACRSEEKTKPVLQAIAASGGQATFLPLDLSDLASVRACAQRFLALRVPLDALINNAGLAGNRGLTKQGFELTFGVNHLGHFLLTQLLLPALKENARVVNVSSRAHYDATGVDFEAFKSPTRTLTGLSEYQVSKLCNVLFTQELARRHPNLHAYAVHPGVVATDVWREVPTPIRVLMKLFMKSTEEGAKTTLYCATSAEVSGHSGRYYDDCQEKAPSALGNDAALAAQLWSKSVEWTHA